MILSAMLIKAGVDISRLNRQIRRCLPILVKIYLEYQTELIITATYDGTHSPGSLHYADDAVDFRYPPGGYASVRNKIRKTIPKGYDIVFHSKHIHLEYDP